MQELVLHTISFNSTQATDEQVDVTGVSTISFKCSISQLFGRYNDLLCQYNFLLGQCCLVCFISIVRLFWHWCWQWIVWKNGSQPTNRGCLHVAPMQLIRYIKGFVFTYTPFWFVVPGGFVRLMTARYTCHFMHDFTFILKLWSKSFLKAFRDLLIMVWLYII
jgi:hypothetical protein